MEIKFSRHPKRRMQLYKIDEDDVRRTIESTKMSKGLQTGKHEEIDYSLKNKYHYPIKVVFTIEDDKIEVTNAVINKDTYNLILTSCPKFLIGHPEPFWIPRSSRRMTRMYPYL